jgi:hypothetical protein
MITEINDEIVKEFWDAYVDGVQKAVSNNTFGYIVLNLETAQFYFTANAQFSKEYPVMPVNYLKDRKLIPADAKRHIALPKEEFTKVKNYLEYALKPLFEKMAS